MINNNTLLKCFKLYKRNWSNSFYIIEIFNQMIMLLFLLYFILQIKELKPFFTVIKNELDSLHVPFYYYIYTYRVQIIIALLFLAFVLKTIFWFLNKLNYSELDKDKFPQYNTSVYPFQYKLIEFLNKTIDTENNIYWLDGGWGSGKTHFLKTFFSKTIL